MPALIEAIDKRNAWRPFCIIGFVEPNSGQDVNLGLLGDAGCSSTRRVYTSAGGSVVA